MIISSISKKALLSALLVFIIIVLDQASKIYIKTHFYLGEAVEVLPFFKLFFVENDGMAFGISIGDKIYLTLFRIVACIAMIAYLVWGIKQNKNYYFVTILSFILAGAMGNIIDCVFYGQIFDYAPYFYGKVVDMLYFPLIEGHFFSWIPFVGGEHFIFFSPVFNIADSFVCVGVFLALIFEKKLFAENQ